MIASGRMSRLRRGGYESSPLFKGEKGKCQMLCESSKHRGPRGWSGRDEMEDAHSRRTNYVDACSRSDVDR
jgi:hypothetical protein